MLRHAHNSVHWFLNDLTSRIIAETGIPSGRFHLGKMIFWSMKEDPSFIMQIDGATGESETNESALKRSVRCAVSFKNVGLTQDDVIVIISPNNLDVAIPLYAALFLGFKVVVLDLNLGVTDLKDSFAVAEPKLIFCQSDKATFIHKVLLNMDMKSEIITFDRCSEFRNFSDFMEQNDDEISVNNFKPANFDPESTPALFASTSGTTGLPKLAVLTHKNLSIALPYLWSSFSNFPTPTQMTMIVSPLQWLSAGAHFVLTPVLKSHRLQSSKPITQELFYELVKKYRPTFMTMSPTMMTYLLKQNNTVTCDISSFEHIIIGGSDVSKNLIETIKILSPGTKTFIGYGTSEIGGLAFDQIDAQNGSVGKPLGSLNYRLVDVETEEDIYEANIPGELWLKGPVLFKEYYKDPEATADAFTEDGWFKTGDILYRDELWNFYFVERFKMIIKYNCFQVSPLEVEAVIKQHPGVTDVAVTSIPDIECSELVVACVVRRPGYTLTAQEIKDLVKDSLAESKHLRGGVIFTDELPMTATTKINRKKLKEMVLNMNRE